MDSRKRLKELIREKALQFGEFTLAHGGESHYYIDGKSITTSPEACNLVGNIIYEMIKDKNVDLIGGLTLGADPVAYSVMSYAYYEHGKNIPVVVVRKEPKKHGTQKYIEGAIKRGDRVVVVDDVITTGNSVLLAIQRLKEADLEVVMVVSIVDRESGAKESLRDYKYCPIFSISEFLDVTSQKRDCA